MRRRRSVSSRLRLPPSVPEPEVDGPTEAQKQAQAEVVKWESMVKQMEDNGLGGPPLESGREALTKAQAAAATTHREPPPN